MPGVPARLYLIGRTTHDNDPMAFPRDPLVEIRLPYPYASLGRYPGWQKMMGTPNELTPEQWLLKYMAAGIDCVAVTDHNSSA